MATYGRPMTRPITTQSAGRRTCMVNSCALARSRTAAPLLIVISSIPADGARRGRRAADQVGDHLAGRARRAAERGVAVAVADQEPAALDGGAQAAAPVRRGGVVVADAHR